ncbi:MAG: hypothetical protein JST62_09490 [Bacteroidetes bacterium]|nr:hypothetical protein [Bacteroidota bacterium]
MTTFKKYSSPKRIVLQELNVLQNSTLIAIGILKATPSPICNSSFAML